MTIKMKLLMSQFGITNEDIQRKIHEMIREQAEMIHAEMWQNRPAPTTRPPLSPEEWRAIAQLDRQARQFFGRDDEAQND